MLTQLNCVYIFKSKLHYRPSNLSGSFTLVPKLSTRQSRSLKCVKCSSEIPNARKKPKLTWHATWHHGGKYWQKKLYSLISLTLSNLSLSPFTLSPSLSLSLPHPLQSLSHSPFTLSLSLIFPPWAPSLPPPPAGHCAPRNHRLLRRVRHSRR